MTMTRLLPALLALTLSGAALLSSAAAATQPLLMDGKQSLFQRVLSIPGARLHDAPGSSNGEGVTPFTAFYVYARRDGWLQVGTGRHGETEGWLSDKDAIDWALDPANRTRVLAMAAAARVDVMGRFGPDQWVASLIRVASEVARTPFPQSKTPTM